MQPCSRVQKYPLTLRFLHWVSAIIILWATVSGLAVSMGYVSESMAKGIAAFNVSVTFIFIPFFLWRLFYRLFFFSNREDVPKSNALSVMVHITMYAFVFVVLFSGILMMDHDYSIFGIIELPPLLGDEKLLSLFSSFHKISTRILGVLVCLHILALIKHELVGDHILRRMT